MSWRLALLASVAFVACASDMKVRKGEPQTAREKMLAEEKAKEGAGTKDTSDDAKPPGSKKWSGWRYQGDRKDCLFLVGRKCFKTEKAACQAAKCKAPTTCEADGGGPATMRCAGGKPDSKDEGDVDEKSDKPKKS
jgi:hypothetical protein